MRLLKGFENAALIGSREITFTIISMTISLVAVFIPIIFMGGMVGRLLNEFAMTISAAVLVSGLVSLTLTPMLCTRLLRRKERHSRFYHATEPFFRGMASRYRAGLEVMLRQRWLALLVLAVCGGLVAVFLRTLPRELAPVEDRGSLRISARGPEGATYAYMDGFMDELGALVAQIVLYSVLSWMLS